MLAVASIFLVFRKCNKASLSASECRASLLFSKKSEYNIDSSAVKQNWKGFVAVAVAAAAAFVKLVAVAAAVAA